MRIFVTGVACVGKTTVGRLLAELRDVPFFDLDNEIERFFDTSIERLHDRFLTPHSYSMEAAKVLVDLLERPESRSSVIALSPSGLMRGFWRVIKKTPGIRVTLEDTPQNILDRITFYDIDSNLVEKELTDKEKRLYLNEIKKDKTYYRTSYKRAHLRVDIAGLDARQAAVRVQEAVVEYQEQGEKTDPPVSR